MKIIIGLGNPDKEHMLTRHNAGFLALDFLQNELHCPAFLEEKKFFCALTETLVGTEKILLVKPETFMNDSGKAVRAILDFYKLSERDIIVLHDDLDIAPGTYKITTSSRAAGHNGVSDIIEKLGTQDFVRIRIGIGRPTEVNGICIPSHDFVLQKFKKEEFENLLALFPKIKEEVLAFIKG